MVHSGAGSGNRSRFDKNMLLAGNITKMDAIDVLVSSILIVVCKVV